MDAIKGAQTRELNTRNCFAVTGENVASEVLVKGPEMGGTSMGKYISIICRINLYERQHLEEMVIDGKIQFTWILKKHDIRVWMRFILRTRLRMFENRVLRRIFGPKRDEVTGGWRKLHNEELHNLYSSPSIIRMIKSRRMRWAGHVARMGRRRRRRRRRKEEEEECVYDIDGKSRRRETTWKTKT
jgi:hypothetical protein